MQRVPERGQNRNKTLEPVQLGYIDNYLKKKLLSIFYVFIIFVRNLNGEITNNVVGAYIVVQIILFLQTQQTRVNLHIRDNVLALQIPVFRVFIYLTSNDTILSVDVNKPSLFYLSWFYFK